MLVAWILLGISLCCWVLFLYPYAIYPLAVRRLSRKPIQPAPVGLTASLLFCVHNEIECLPDKIDNLRELKHARADLQILVYDDASTDGSVELLASVPELLTLVRGPGRTGKAAGMKQLVRQARGDILIFTDANIMLSRDVVDRLLPYYGDSEVGGAACTLKMLTDRVSATSRIGSAYWGLDDRLQQLESATGNVMGATGGLFSVRRSLYPADFPSTVQDDFAVSMNVIFQGKRLIKTPDVIAFERTVSHRDEGLQRKVRIGARAYHTHSYLRPRLRKMSARDRFKYVSRKMLRWFGGLFLALGALFALVGVALLSMPLAGLMTVAGIIAIAIAIRARRGYFAQAGEAGLATFATFFGVLQGMSGRTMATWSPAKSR